MLRRSHLVEPEGSSTPPSSKTDKARSRRALGFMGEGFTQNSLRPVLTLRASRLRRSVPNAPKVAFGRTRGFVHAPIFHKRQSPHKAGSVVYGRGIYSKQPQGCFDPAGFAPRALGAKCSEGRIWSNQKGSHTIARSRSIKKGPNRSLFY